MRCTIAPRRSRPAAGATTLAMSKLDPDADFSSDYEDLAFVRVADCGVR